MTPRDWFTEMEGRYQHEIEPRPDDPGERKAWNARGMAWARSVDPEGAEAAMTALLEEAVDEGIIEHYGVDAQGRIVYESNIYRTDEEGQDH
jgi:hypothetical protein